jgi:hypothetical protein
MLFFAKQSRMMEVGKKVMSIFRTYAAEKREKT